MSDIRSTPATACTLSGAYLIEASAGTGKTWTLSGIILRLLVEKKYAPERIIATTFTRAAAAEMQERIQARLTTFYRYLTWMKSKQATHESWFDRKIPTSDRLNEIVTTAKQAGIDEADDIVNQHLIEFLINHEDDFAFDEAFRRVGLLLSMLDKLFVGTLDSLAQKWLKEFAAEIGHQAKAEIQYDSDDVTTAIIHDSLRKKHAQIITQNPKLYAFIAPSNVLSDIHGTKVTINLTTQFFDAPIDSMPDIDDAYVESLEAELDEILSYDLDEIHQFLDDDYRKKVGINGHANLPKSLDKLTEIQALIREHGIGFVNHLEPLKNWIKNIEKIKDITNLTNKNYDHDAVMMLYDFIQKKLINIPPIIEKIRDISVQYRAYLYRQIAEDVRRLSPSWLEGMGKTTFTLQMKRLNDALASSKDLVRRIRHHYPVALIDESQDVNGAQVALIKRVYIDPLQDELQNNKTPKGFLLLVGDPKQAIYRFRGGDVSNYNYIKYLGNAQHQQDKQRQIINKDLTLTVNRRSNKALIDALNQWFVNESFDGLNPAKLGEGIYYQHIEAHNQTQRLSWQNKSMQASYLDEKPLTVLHTSYLNGDDAWQKHQAIAHHINSLLQNSHCTMDDNGRSRPIVPSDIAILAKTKAEFSAVKGYLDKLNIPAIAIKDENVFAMPAANDLYALLAVCLDAGNLEKVGRLLSGYLFGLSLDDITTLFTDESDQMSQDGAEQKIRLFGYLAKMREQWQKYGIASAIWYALSINPLNDKRSLSDGLWLNAAKAGERYLADLWQVVELVGEQSHLHETALLEWFEIQMQEGASEYNKRRVLPSEAGVNLMTIHASKGLEFPIVYVLGLEKSVKGNNALFYPYSDDKYQRRISPVRNRGDVDYGALDLTESVDEAKRIGYVALTRASEQVYVVASDSYYADNSTSPMFIWCQASKQKALTLPERMQGKMGWIELLDCEDLIKSRYNANDKPQSCINYVDWHVAIPKQSFEGIHQASFTRLINQLESSQGMMDDDKQDVHDEMVIDDSSDEVVERIQNTFVRGATAGEFLHLVLQEVGTSMPITDRSGQLLAISQEIDRQARKLGLAEYLSHKHQSMPLESDKNTPHRQLVLWLYEVIHAKFGASGTNLKSLHNGNSVREMKFVLGLKHGFGVADINAVFEEHSDHALELTPDHNDRVYHYLKGEIDLLYEHEGRFFVLDYKSNFLGDDWRDYDRQSLISAMYKAGYWLQAAFYQVALHRLLKMRIADYVGNESRYLGATEYLFLRGISSDDERGECGRMIWQIPLNLTLALDELFE